MYCLLCTISIILLTSFGLFKLAFFASFISGPKNDDNANSIQHQYDVIILGAGISGIAAATELYKNGITNILIIEAEDYVGGRIKTGEIDGHVLNIGATTIYGASTKCSNNILVNKRNPIVELLDKYHMKYFIDNTSLLTDNIKHLHKMYGNQDLYISDELGMNGILLYLAAELIENGVNILLNEPIHKISHDMNSVVIHTKSGILYHSKYTINTFSFGVLQSNLIHFVPSLPSWKYDAFLKYKMVKYTSIHIKWPYHIWFKTAKKLFLIQNPNYNLSIYNMHDNIWKIDVRNNNPGIDKNIYEFVINETRKFLNDFPKPLDIVITNWNGNIYTKGVHSIFKSNNDKNIDIYDHRKRIKSRVDNIFFSGDGTSEKHYGTVNGAYTEGINTAQDIVACFESQIFGKCPTEYIERDNDIFIDILKQFTDDYKFYCVLSIRFVITRLIVLLSFVILIIRKIAKYMLKDSF